MTALENAGTVTAAGRSIARAEIEDFLYAEADLLDAWRYDDWGLLRARVKRLKSRKAHAENPPSRTHRLVSNVRVFDDGADTVRVTASFIVHRARDGEFDTYIGKYEHILAVTDSGLRYRRRRAVLGYEQLPPGARLSFIL
jgi:p-cumate 2,3-dioxygenase beta subunit